MEVIKGTIARERSRAEGDDLDTGLAYDVSFSGSENDGDLEPLTTDFEEGGFGEGREGERETETQRETERETEREIHGGKKRKQKSSKLGEKKRIKMEMDTQQKKALAKEASVDVIVDWINSKIGHKHSELSTLELSELFFGKSEVRSSAEFTEERNLKNLPAFISKRFVNMLPAAKKKGAKSKGAKQQLPGHDTNKNESNESDTTAARKFIAVISMSALRACDVHRSTRQLAGSSIKVINKNKLSVDIDILSKTTSRILCCTPGRLKKVLDSPELPLRREEIKIVIVDNSYLDQKCQNIWDIKETASVLKELTNTGSKIYLY